MSSCVLAFIKLESVSEFVILLIPGIALLLVILSTNPSGQDTECGASLIRLR